MDVLNGPCAELNYILRKLCEHGDTMGLAVLRKGFNPWTNRKLRFFSVILVVYFVMVFNTLLQTQGGGIIDRAFCCATYGYMFQAVLKVYVFLAKRHTLAEMCQLFHVIVAQEKNEQMDKYVRASVLAYKLIKGVYYASYVIIITGPYTVGLITGDRILPFPLYLPWVDSLKTPGYELNYLMITYMMFLYTNGVLATESLFLVHILLAMGHLHRIIDKVVRLDRQLKQGVSEAELQEMIAAIVKEHQEHRRSFKLFDEIFSNHSLVMVLSASVMIIVCLLLLLQEFWLLGLVMIVLGILQVLFICATGSIFETTCGRLERAVTDVDWNLMTPKLRRDWVVVMHFTQRPVLFTLGGVNEANLRTFLKVMRSLYTTLMVLLGMAE